MAECKYCGSNDTVKNGKINGTQLIKCKNCGHKFLDNGKFPKMQTNPNIIINCLDMYFDGLSTRKIQNYVKRIYLKDINQATIWRWMAKYSKLVKAYTDTLTPKGIRG